MDIGEAVRKHEKEFQEAGYEGLALITGNYSLAALSADLILPENLKLKLMGVI